MHFCGDTPNWLVLVSSSAALILGVLGCSPEHKLKTYPVKGKVVLKQGDIQRLAEGYVELRSIGEPKVIAMGEIKPDGSFELGSQVAGKDYVGAPEGDYQARIILPTEGGGQPRSSSPIVAPRFLALDKSELKYTVKPGRNEFNIEIEGPRH
jgi:hypothetical protein